MFGLASRTALPAEALGSPTICEIDCRSVMYVGAAAGIFGARFRFARAVHRGAAGRRQVRNELGRGFAGGGLAREAARSPGPFGGGERRSAEPCTRALAAGRSGAGRNRRRRSRWRAPSPRRRRHPSTTGRSLRSQWPARSTLRSRRCSRWRWNWPRRPRRRPRRSRRWRRYPRSRSRTRKPTQPRVRRCCRRSPSRSPRRHSHRARPRWSSRRRRRSRARPTARLGAGDVAHSRCGPTHCARGCARAAGIRDGSAVSARSLRRGGHGRALGCVRGVVERQRRLPESGRAARAAPGGAAARSADRDLRERKRSPVARGGDRAGQCAVRARAAMAPPKPPPPAPPVWAA